MLTDITANRVPQIKITPKLDEGVTCFDHPLNPRYPASWHVRDNGLMSPAFCLRDEYLLEKTKPLELCYGLHIHLEKIEP